LDHTGGIGKRKKTINLNVVDVILNWQKPLWEEEYEVVKRSSRDESIWIEIHMHGNNTKNLPV
jgi:hypothetical protein